MQIKFKHLFAIEFAIKLGTIKDIDKLPNTTTKANLVVNEGYTTTSIQVAPSLSISSQSSYKEDDYTF